MTECPVCNTDLEKIDSDKDATLLKIEEMEYLRCPRCEYQEREEKSEVWKLDM